MLVATSIFLNCGVVETALFKNTESKKEVAGQLN